jgi:glycosyltransferase involved in cell wall biosynthesis
MRKVLCLAYHFPPVGGAAVQRNARLIGHLPEFGYEPVVVTGVGRRESHWTPQDETLEVETLMGADVRRIPGEDTIVEASRWRGRAERWLGLETPWAHWWTHGVIDVVPHLPADIELVHAPLVPFGCFHAARCVSEMLRKPLVVDLHDPWAFDEMMVYPTRLHRWRAKRAMHTALSFADGIVMNTPEAAARVLQAFPDLAATPVFTIPNGFSADNFAGDVQEPEGDVFRIVHTGYLHTEQGREHRRLQLLHRLLGGTLANVDILTRSHVFLLEAVERLLRREPELKPIEIHLAGVLTSADKEVAAQAGIVKLHGYVPHWRAVELMRSADLLFLPMQEIAEGRRVGIIPGKTFEYIAARKPILAAIPEGDARDLLGEAGNAIICGPSDVEAMAEAVADQIRRKRRGIPPAIPTDEFVKRHEWRCRSRELARLFDRTLDRGQGRSHGEATAVRLSSAGTSGR